MLSAGRAAVAVIVSLIVAVPLNAAGMVADPISVDFGDLALIRFDGETGLVRCFAEAPITIANRGEAPLEILAVVVTGEPHFELRRHECTLLPPGGRCSAVVRYAPRAAGAHAGELIVRASDGSDVVVPLWGDADFLACAGSACDAPLLSFGAAPPGTVRTRTIGVVNDMTASVLATVHLSGDASFSADIPEPQTVDPGAEYLLEIFCECEGMPGVRKAVCVFNLPPPMLPVQRECRIPLLAHVIGHLEPIASLEVHTREIRLEGTAPFRAEALHRVTEAGVSRRLLLPALPEGRPSVDVCAVSYGGASDPPEFSAWQRFELTGVLALDQEPLVLAPLLAARSRHTSHDEAFVNRLRGCALILSAGKALLLDPRDGEIVDEGPFAARGFFSNISCTSELWQSRAYVIRRESALPCLLALRATADDGGLAIYRPGRCASLSEVLGEGGKSIRAMDVVAVRQADGAWEEMLVMVALFEGGAGGLDAQEQRLFLLGRRGSRVEAQVTLAPRFGPVSMVHAAAYIGRPTGEGAHGAIACYVGRSGGRMVRYQALRGIGKDAWNWTNNPMRFQLDTGELLSMRRAVGGMPIGRRQHDHIGQFLVAGRTGVALVDCAGQAVHRIASLRTEGSILAASRPRHTLGGEEQPLYLLREQPDGNIAVTACRVPFIPDPDGRKQERPVALTGDCLFVRELEAETGATGADVTIEAHAFDPGGRPVFYSWTAPGIEFDDPTSPTPTARFPIGETLVFLVVRNGPAGDPQTIESRPSLVRVLVKEKAPDPAVCGDANADGTVNIGDAISILAYLFAQGPPPPSPAAADVNASGQIDIADAVYLLAYLFAQGPAPACGP